jgi:hypothetical protein
VRADKLKGSAKNPTKGRRLSRINKLALRRALNKSSLQMAPIAILIVGSARGWNHTFGWRVQPEHHLVD